MERKKEGRTNIWKEGNVGEEGRKKTWGRKEGRKYMDPPPCLFGMHRLAQKLVTSYYTSVRAVQDRSQ